MRHLVRVLTVVFWLVAVPLARAADVEVEGYKFPDAATVFGQNLVLNGAGVSAILSTKATVVAFYLPKKQTTMEGAVTEKGAKRIQLYMLRDVSARDLSNVLVDRIRQNAADDFSTNIMQFAQLGAIFGTRTKVFKGDMMVCDYNPTTQTTEFSLNGQKIGDTIKGDTFFGMLMKVWIGPKVRGSTRDALLGIKG